jgi:3-hydroxybutyryl-CoA dehydrogenase
MHERLGIAGSGAIACGLAAAAARHGQVVLWARSDGSAQRARGSVLHICGRLSGEVDAGHVRVETDLDALTDATAVIEAVTEDEAIKSRVLADLGRVAGDDAILATTTSSLSVERLARATGMSERFVGLHVFNPVPKMELVELQRSRLPVRPGA